MKQVALIFVLTCAAVFALLRSGIIERLSYGLEKGRLRAVRESLPDADRVRELGFIYRRVAEAVTPAVVRIETEFSSPKPSAHAEVGSPKARHDDFTDDEIADSLRQWLFRHPDRAGPPGDEDPADAADAPGRSVSRGLGSGFVVDAERGYILTNAHVVHGASAVWIYLADGRRAQGRVLGLEPRVDLAVVEIDGGSLFELPLGDSETVAVGDEVFAAGNPFGLSGTLSKGIISGLGRRNVMVAGDPHAAYLQTDAVISAGSSGGPLVNLSGEVIGVNTAIATTTGYYDGVGFAIPIDRVKAILEDLVAGGPGFLGVMVGDVADPEFESEVRDAGWTEMRGALVHRVMPGLAAQRDGLMPHDIIFKIDDDRVESGAELGRIVASHKRGSAVRVHVWRDGQAVTLSVRLGGRYEPR